MTGASRTLHLLAPLSGIVVPLAQVPDPVFAAGTVGAGVGIDPTSSELLAPVAGVVTQLHRAHHALAIRADEGIEVLIHVGIDTVTLRGEGLVPRVALGERVVAGQPLLGFDADFVATRAASLVTPVIVTSADCVVRSVAEGGVVRAGHDRLLVVELGPLAGSAAAPAEPPALTTPSGPTARVEVELPNPDGLHARPAATLAAAAKRYHADIRLRRGEAQANAKSLTSIMLLGTHAHDRLEIVAAGADAQAAVRDLAELIAAGCGESAAAGGPPADAAPLPATAVTPGAGTLTGQPASPGIAVGRVVQLRHLVHDVPEQGTGPVQERARFELALAEARRAIAALRAPLAESPQARILDAHIELLADPELLDPVLAALESGASAARLWRQSYGGYAARLERVDNPLLRERARDVRDVGERVLGVLAGTGAVELPPGTDLVLIAEDLAPSETAALDRQRVLAVCTVGGSATGHAAILARMLGIPAICALDPAARALPDGCPVLVDGGSGVLRPNPAPEEVTHARARGAEQLRLREADAALAAQAAVTLDGERIEVAANIRDGEEARAAVAAGADAVGLLRSEFLFSGRDRPPAEHEQSEAYRGIAATLGRGRRLVIRTLDVGGDKPLAYLPLPPEANPFLGVRGIRVTLERPELLRTQLRAILAAAPLGDLHVMFPMVAMLEELRRARALLAEEAAAAGVAVKVGVMIEVPSAALIAEALAPDVDFFSIGTNDLTQYTLAMDRGHPRLAAQADGLHPAVLRLIALTVEAAHRHGRWVGVCGGLAAEPLAIPALIGLGVDELSVAVPAVASVKASVRRLSRARCRALATQLLGLATAGEVRAALAACVASP
ncbi:MAG: phosphoenolpyruvate--protein phosphotransferase [Proteobacteria bacterium]|nr:phosphoenolpyruvate--protein phosphotransferase [Pseudomonadota bacterium]